MTPPTATLKQTPTQQQVTRPSSHGRYMKSIVYGGLDGIVTTFVVVAGVTGAQLDPQILFILGLSNLVGGAFSMGIGDYASSDAEREFEKSERDYLASLIDTDREPSRNKIKQIYMAKGLSTDDAEAAAHLMMKNTHTAVEILMVEEHGGVESNGSPVRRGVYTFFSFLVFGSIPLFIYMFSPFVPVLREHIFASACVMTAITLFVLGAAKANAGQQHWLVSGLQMVVIGGISSSCAYAIGYFFSGSCAYVIGYFFSGIA